MLGGGALAGGSILCTGAVSRSEIGRGGEIVVSKDSDAYLDLSTDITNDLAGNFEIDPSSNDDGTDKDTILKLTNQLPQSIDGVELKIDSSSNNDLEINGGPAENFNSGPFDLPSGESEFITANLTTFVQNPTLTYTVTGGKKGNDVSIEATRTRDINCPEKVISDGGESNDSGDEHLFRFFPKKFSNNEDLQKVEITYPKDDFDLSGSSTIRAKIGDSIAKTNDTESITRESTSGSKQNKLTIEFPNDSPLDSLKQHRRVQIEYANVKDFVDFTGVTVDITIEGQDGTSEILSEKSDTRDPLPFFEA